MKIIKLFAMLALIQTAVPAFGTPYAAPYKFNYQGRLEDGGRPASGTKTFSFKLYDALSGGTLVWDSGALSVTLSKTGSFAATLENGTPTLAPSVFTGDRWIEIAIDGTTLSPREPIISTPYSLAAQSLTESATAPFGLGIEDFEPAAKTYKLYNKNGTLYWSGSPVAGGVGDAVLAGTQTFTGQNTFTSLVTVSSSIRINDGNQGSGKVLTSDSGGTARWASGSDVYLGANQVFSGTNTFSGTTHLTGKVGIGLTADPLFWGLDLNGPLIIRNDPTWANTQAGMFLLTSGGVNYIQSAGAGMEGGGDLKFTNKFNGATWLTFEGATGKAAFNNMVTVSSTVKITGGGPGAGKVLTSTDAAGNAAWVMPAVPGDVFRASTQTFTGQNTFSNMVSVSSIAVVNALRVSGGSLAAGRVLTSDSSGNATWAPPASGGGNVYLSSAQTFTEINTFNNQVGIYTTNLSTPLYVKKGVVAEADGQPNGNFSAIIYNATNEPGQNGLLVKNNWFNSSSTLLEVGNDFEGGAYTSLFKIDGSGNVGISTGTPKSKLDIIGPGVGAFFVEPYDGASNGGCIGDTGDATDPNACVISPTGLSVRSGSRLSPITTNQPIFRTQLVTDFRATSDPWGRVAQGIDIQTVLDSNLDTNFAGIIQRMHDYHPGYGDHVGIASVVKVKSHTPAPILPNPPLPGENHGNWAFWGYVSNAHTTADGSSHPGYHARGIGVEINTNNGDDDYKDYLSDDSYPDFNPNYSMTGISLIPEGKYHSTHALWINGGGGDGNNVGWGTGITNTGFVDTGMYINSKLTKQCYRDTTNPRDNVLSDGRRVGIRFGPDMYNLIQVANSTDVTKNTYGIYREGSSLVFRDAGVADKWWIAMDRSNSAIGFNNYSVFFSSSAEVGIGTITPKAALEVNGGARLNTEKTKPTCDADARGTFWVTKGGAGTKDSVEVCAKDAFDAYDWRTLY